MAWIPLLFPHDDEPEREESKPPADNPHGYGIYDPKTGTGAYSAPGGTGSANPHEYETKKPDTPYSQVYVCNYCREIFGEEQDAQEHYDELHVEEQE